VHLAFSYDEEIGCLGAPSMIEVIRRELPAPAFVVVGEPTDMEAVSGHKGIATFHVTVTGREVHSSQPHLGVSAVMEAVEAHVFAGRAGRAAAGRGRPGLARSRPRARP
jgi:acetylornithine deacetylase